MSLAGSIFEAGWNLMLRRAAAAVDRFDAEVLRLGFEQGELHQRLDGLRRRAVAVGQFGANAFGFLGVADVGDALVGAQALLLVGDVFGRECEYRGRDSERNALRADAPRPSVPGRFLRAERR